MIMAVDNREEDTEAETPMGVVVNKEDTGISRTMAALRVPTPKASDTVKAMATPVEHHMAVVDMAAVTTSPAPLSMPMSTLVTRATAACSRKLSACFRESTSSFKTRMLTSRKL